MKIISKLHFSVRCSPECSATSSFYLVRRTSRLPAEKYDPPSQYLDVELKEINRNTVSGFRSLQDRIFVPALLHVLYHLPQIPNVENDEEAIHKVHLQFSFIFCISL